jgi:periplasmic protein CpxP/Spy
MKKVILFFALILTFSTFMSAQNASETPNTTIKKEKRGKGKHMGDRGAHLKKELNLNDAQSAKLKSIHDTQKGKMAAIKSDNTLSKEEKKSKIKEMKAAHDTEMKSVLTHEQYTKWSEMKKNKKGKMGKGNRQGKHGEMRKNKEVKDSQKQ